MVIAVLIGDLVNSKPPDLLIVAKKSLITRFLIVIPG